MYFGHSEFEIVIGIIYIAVSGVAENLEIRNGLKELSRMDI